MSDDLMVRNNGDDWTWVWTTPEPTDWTNLLVEIRRGQDSDDELVASSNDDGAIIFTTGHTDIMPNTNLSGTPAVLAWGIVASYTGVDVFEPGTYWLKVSATGASLGGTKTVMHRILTVNDGGAI